MQPLIRLNVVSLRQMMTFVYNVNPRIPQFNTKVAAEKGAYKVERLAVWWSNPPAPNAESQNIHFGHSRK